MKKNLQKIVCIDDDKDILDIVEYSFKTATNIDITCYLNDNNISDIVLQDPPDLILLDVMMPKTDGITLLKNFRTKVALNKTAIILMTARVQPKEIEDYIAFGASAVIAKPFDALKLPADVQTIWEKFYAKITK